MKLLTNATDFINTLKKTSKVMYQSSNLKAIVDRINANNSKRELRIRYEYFNGEQWVKFSTFCSPSLSDIILDFSNEQKLYDR